MRATMRWTPCGWRRGTGAGATTSSAATPLEAGLGFAVAWDKPGGFIGREALSKQKEQGVRRRLLQNGRRSGPDPPAAFRGCIGPDLQAGSPAAQPRRVFAPDESFTVDPARLHHRHSVTPYAGRRLLSVVRGTILRGEPTESARPRGRLLAEG